MMSCLYGKLIMKMSIIISFPTNSVIPYSNDEDQDHFHSASATDVGYQVSLDYSKIVKSDEALQ